VRAGLASVNGKVQCKPSFGLRPGDEVTLSDVVSRPSAMLHVRPEPITLDVAYEDDHVLVVHKPAHMVVHPAPGNPDGTLVNAVLHHCNFPGITIATTDKHAQQELEDDDEEDEHTNKDVDGLAGDKFLQASQDSYFEASSSEFAVAQTESGSLSYFPDLQHPCVPRPGIVHRLDKGTSGLMVVAKNDNAKQSLQKQFMERTVEREYVAIVCGRIKCTSVDVHRHSSTSESSPQPLGVGRISTLIGRDLKERKRMAAYASDGNHHPYHRKGLKLAVSNYTTEDCDLAGGGASLVTWRLETGRTHQIRVHAKHVGCPLVGDEVYGGTWKRLLGCLKQSGQVSDVAAKKCIARLESVISRPALHAATLGFIHPTTKKLMRFQRDPPQDFTEALRILRDVNGTERK